jgi:nitrogen regulation protein NR(I)
MNTTVLIVDDEKNILLTLKRALELADYQVEVAGGGHVALDVLAAKPVDVVLMDVRMPDMDGLDVLRRMHELRPNLPVVMMSGHGTIETAVKATQLGARDFLEKPIETARLLVALRNALEHSQLQAAVAELKGSLGQFEMVGEGPAMQKLYGLIKKTAPSEGRVLITGENGSGKELIARAIHSHSRRSKGPFVKLNCAAVPAELIESELFGHEKGAFTGAVTARRGKFEQADGGTLFLDEVGDMPANMQAKLLRVLQEGEFERVGGSETLKVDVRVLAATNKDIQRAIDKNEFREDLYYRLNVVPLHVPPLRDRKEDIPSLVKAFLAESCVRNGYRAKTLSPSALAAFQAYDYPGNVRELKNLVERLAILSEGPEIAIDDAVMVMPAPRARSGASTSSTPTSNSAPAARVDRFKPGVTFREQVEQAEREIIIGALAATRDNVTEAARMLDLERGHFYKKMKALGMRRSSEPADTTTSAASTASTASANPNPGATSSKPEGNEG